MLTDYLISMLVTSGERYVGYCEYLLQLQKDNPLLLPSYFNLRHQYLKQQQLAENFSKAQTEVKETFCKYGTIIFNYSLPLLIVFRKRDESELSIWP